MGKRLSKGGPDTLTQTMSSSSARQRAAVTTRAAQRMRAHSVLGNLQDGVKSAVNQQLDVVKPAARESHRLRSCAGLRLPRAGRARCQCARSALVPLPATGSSLGIYFDHLALDMVLQLRMAAAALQLLLAGHANSLRVAPEMRLTALGETLTAAQRAWLHSNASQVVRGGAFAAPTFDRNRTANATSLYYTPDDKSDPRKQCATSRTPSRWRPTWCQETRWPTFWTGSPTGSRTPRERCPRAASRRARRTWAAWTTARIYACCAS